MLIAANKLIEAGPFLLPSKAASKAGLGGAGMSAKQLVPRAKKKRLKLLDKAGPNRHPRHDHAPARIVRRPRRSFELMRVARETGTNWLRKNFSEFATRV